MTTLREQLLTEIADVFGDAPLAEDTLIYFRERFRRRLHQLILEEFVRLEAAGISRAHLARRINRKPEQITRWLAAPGNWTLDTVSDLLLAMGGEVSLDGVEHLGDRLRAPGRRERGAAIVNESRARPRSRGPGRRLVGAAKQPR
jgi:hypothetical protein